MNQPVSRAEWARRVAADTAKLARVGLALEFDDGTIVEVELMPADGATRTVTVGPGGIAIAQLDARSVTREGS